MLKQIANAVLFQIGWLACVLGGNSLWLLLALAVLVIHLLLDQQLGGGRTFDSQRGDCRHGGGQRFASLGVFAFRIHHR